MAVIVKPFARFALYFVAALLASALLMSALSVYAFNQYEPAWGHGGSLQVEWWLSFAVAFCALFTVGVAVQWLAPARSVGRAAAFASGMVFVLVTIAVAWLLGRPEVRAARSLVLLWVFAGPPLLGVTVMRVLGKPAS